MKATGGANPSVPNSDNGPPMAPIKTAIVFASFIEREEYLPFCEKIIEIWRREFATSDIYVGINPCRFQEPWIAMLECSGLRIRYRVVPELLVLPSDASAYQAALSLLHEDNAAYDFVWFGHTKGATSRQYEELAAHLVELFLKKELVMQTLRATGCGLYALAASVAPKGREGCSRYMRFRYTALPIFCVFTFYVLRGEILHRFVQACDASFFTQRLPDAHFFEADFPQIAFRQGYEPHVKKIVQVHCGELAKLVSNEETYHKTLAAWRAKNGLKPPAGA